MKLRKMMKLIVLMSLTMLALTLTASAQQDRKNNPGRSSDAVWQAIDDSRLRLRPLERHVVPEAYRAFRLNKTALVEILNQAPFEFTEAARARGVVLTLPMPDGSFARFRIEESPVVEKGLAAKFPELGRTYRGQGIDDPVATARFDFLPDGFHAIILSNKVTVAIDPYAKGDTENHISYNKSDLPHSEPFHCDFQNTRVKLLDLDKYNSFGAEHGRVDVINGSQLRTYRLAITSPVEYTVAAGGVAGALAAQVTLINRVNGIYEKELAIHFNIIANNNLLVFTMEPDGFDGENMALEINQAKTDAIIGAANYDVGHLINIGTDGGFAAGNPCDNDSKAKGYSGPRETTTSLSTAALVAHEIGHQFGADHNFNASCGGNRGANAAYEPGSGITIMSYPGVCDPQNLAPESIENFHVKALEEIIAFRETGGTCGPATATGNTPPTAAVLGGTSFNIPKQTPFTLTATATDADLDLLTYDWQEYDLGPMATAVPNSDADGMAKPIFRPYLPTLGPSRTFPSLQYILNNANVPPATYDCGLTPACVTGEMLPAITRVMKFQVIVRDNRANGGGINTAMATVNVDGNSGPMRVTAPNTGVTLNGNSQQTVTWDVANTNNAPVSAANVQISLSVDGGQTFTTTILASTPNDGTETITVPNTGTTTARIKVSAVGNIFFDISDANFTINAVAVPLNKTADFDGDGKTDISVFRPSSGYWYLLRSAQGFTAAQFGQNGDQLAPGDFDGDGKTDISVFRNGIWYRLNSTNGAFVYHQFGTAGDVAVPGRYDTDNKTDIAVFRPATGAWYVLKSTDGVMLAQQFGLNGDLPITGDFDGDGRTDFTVFRPASGFWYMLQTTAGFSGTAFGLNGDQPVPGDYDGDAKTDVAVFRPSNGTWYLQRSQLGFTGLNWGLAGDRPSPGDYDGDDKTDVAVFRPSNGLWYILQSQTGQLKAELFGTNGDLSVPGAYIP